MNDRKHPPTLKEKLSGLAALMRPRQWIKNGFVLAPLVFSGHFMKPDAIRESLVAALLFCLTSSTTYIVNDVRDMDRDRRHPKKSKTRPLASGLVSARAAWLLLAALYAALSAGFLIQPAVMPVLLGYIVLNLAYTFYLKNQPLLDIFTVAAGFVIRVYAGAVAISVPLSPWMFVTTLCLALYLVSIKRRQEIASNPGDTRKVLKSYSLPLIDRYAEMSATGALVFYSLFVMSARPQLVVTIPLVVFGLFRYWLIVDRHNGGESPTDALLEDKQLLLAVALWIAACVWSLWPTT